MDAPVAPQVLSPRIKLLTKTLHKISHWNFYSQANPMTSKFEKIDFQKTILL